MWDIKKRFDDSRRPHGKGLLCLDCDRVLHPSALKWPITWSGYLNGEEIKIIQEKGSSRDPSNYRFEKFPKEYGQMKSVVIDWIDKKLETLD